MEETDSPPTAHKPCLAAKRPLMAPYSEAAKALLSSPLPPELVVDFKGDKHLYKLSFSCIFHLANKTLFLKQRL